MKRIERKGINAFGVIEQLDVNNIDHGLSSIEF
jgi:hypothetical protein